MTTNPVYEPRRGILRLHHDVLDMLFDFLDENEPNAQSLPAIALLYGELVKGGLFSYELYVQRLIARGEPGLLFSDVSTPLS